MIGTPRIQLYAGPAPVASGHPELPSRVLVKLSKQDPKSAMVGLKVAEFGQHDRMLRLHFMKFLALRNVIGADEARLGHSEIRASVAADELHAKPAYDGVVERRSRTLPATNAEIATRRSTPRGNCLLQVTKAAS